MLASGDTETIRLLAAKVNFRAVWAFQMLYQVIKQVGNYERSISSLNPVGVSRRVSNAGPPASVYAPPAR